MAVLELQFSKSDIDAPWGFRLAGGAECDVPLTVVKVAEGGIAESIGLQVSDVVIKVNDVNVESLTHAETHDVILNAGDNFTLTVQRTDTFDDVSDDERSNEEVSNIMEGTLQKETATKMESLKKEKSAAVYEKRNVNLDIITDEQIAELISGEAEVLPEQNVLGVNFNKIDLEGSTVLKAINEDTEEAKVDLQNKKWSTFLQTPKRPVVKPKKNEPEGPRAPPYRVIIKKQKKKSAEEIANQIKASQTSKAEITNETNNLDNTNETEEGEESEKDILEENTYIHQEEEEENEDENKDEMLEFRKSDEEVSVISLEDEDQEQRITETLTTQSSLSLEEQLAQVQQQLQALAQLPSAIQVTLDAVTQQLSKIVNATNKRKEELQETTVDQTVSNEDETLEHTAEETAESVTKLEEDEETSYLEETMRSERTDTLEREEEYEEKESNEQASETTIEENPTEEEIQAKQLEEEKAAQQERIEEFHQRRLEQRPTHPLTPLQRPIVLPGGRKWSQPDDALPAVKKPQVSDEKICEMIETYSEVITGKTKGINFLKYQPPPKNLDYLQHSEVFKLVHDMDPPRRGIAARTGKIASAQDYYTGKPLQGTQQTAVGI